MTTDDLQSAHGLRLRRSCTGIDAGRSIPGVRAPKSLWSYSLAWTQSLAPRRSQSR